jgi:hypothetical protein
MMVSVGISEQDLGGGWVADLHNEQRDGGRFYVYVRAPGDITPVALVLSGVEGFGREEGRARALLIAAAPELLEKCTRAAKVFRTYAEMHRGKGTEEGDAKAITNELIAEEIEEVISKARGQAVSK